MSLCQKYIRQDEKDSPLLGESCPSRMDRGDFGRALFACQRQYFVTNKRPRVDWPIFIEEERDVLCLKR
jgi:hypothetical protein